MAERTEAITRYWEMGLTHAEFFRTLPAAMGEQPYRIEGDRVIVEQPDRRLVIRLDPQTVRRIALLQVPSTRVHFTFEGYPAADAEAFLDRFARYYQRGGG